MHASRFDLIKKFHLEAHKVFPVNCDSIPTVLTYNETIQLYSLSYLNRKYSMKLVIQYNISEIPGRVLFIIDIFRISPVEGCHLAPGVRIKTRNGHHVTLNALKEFDNQNLTQI